MLRSSVVEDVREDVVPDVQMRTGLIWLRKEASGGSLWTPYVTWGFMKGGEFLSKVNALEEIMFSTELIMLP
jgi:hypothetical protein